MSHGVLAQDKANRPTATGLYVHVPFCARTCDYCAFYQSAPDAAAVRQYLEGIAREADLVSWPDSIDTVFWGGGTPGILSPRDLALLGSTLRARMRGTPVEWTIEMTPLSVTEARLDALREIGVTRISLGVQSFQPALLDALGRQHTPEQAFRAAERVRAAGFASVNFDLMFALPGQVDTDWEADLRQAIALAPDHLSTYCLTFEEDTKLWLKLSQGKVRRDVEAEARLYAFTWDFLEAAGYAQYEISNFARPGHRCLHNLNTWRMTRWIGLGPSAASQYAGWRCSNVADLQRWLELLSEDRRATEDRSELSPALLAEDTLIFGLRMNDGVEPAALRPLALLADWPLVDALFDALLADGLLERSGPAVRLTRRGRMVADSVGAELTGLLTGNA